MSVDGPPESTRKAKRLLVGKDGKLSKVALVRLSNHTSFLATRVNETLRDTEEQGLPFCSFRPISDHMISFEDATGEEWIVSVGQITSIT